MNTISASVIGVCVFFSPTLGFVFGEITRSNGLGITTVSKPKKKLPTFEAECARILRSYGYRATVQPAKGHDRASGWVKMILIVSPADSTAYETKVKCAELLIDFSLTQHALPLLQIA